MNVVLFAVLGVLTWTLLEYLIHRFLGHEPRLRPNPFATEHVRHHSEGDYFAPTWKKLLAAVVVTGALAWPLYSLLGATLAAAYLGGLMGFYGVYEWLHRREHTHAGIGWYGRWARRHHFAHHYADARCNHGVTTPMWDWVFGTLRTVETVRVPQRFAMPWLKDERGQVRAEFADVFFIA